MSLVLDCSATAAWVIPEEATPIIDSLFGRIRVSSAHVPFIWPAEIANVLMVAARRGRMTVDQIAPSLEDLSDHPIHIDTAGRDRTWTHGLALARAYSLSVYDALYLELALRLSLPLATFDKRLREAAVQAGVELSI